MRIDEALEQWRQRDLGVTLLLGGVRQLEDVAARLEADRTPIVRLNRVLLDALPDRDALLAAEDELSSRAVGDESRALLLGAHRGQLRRALATAFEAWLAAHRDRPGPLVIRDLELAAAERVELARLADLGRPVLLLVPGRREASGQVLLGEQPSVRLPAALCGPRELLVLDPPEGGPA